MRAGGRAREDREGREGVGESERERERGRAPDRIGERVDDVHVRTLRREKKEMNARALAWDCLGKYGIPQIK